MMCCTWFAHDCALSTWAYVLETVRGAVSRLWQSWVVPFNAIIIIFIIIIIIITIISIIIIIIITKVGFKPCVCHSGRPTRHHWAAARRQGSADSQQRTEAWKETKWITSTVHPHPKTDKGTLPHPSPQDWQGTLPHPSPQDWQRYLTSSLTPRLTRHLTSSLTPRLTRHLTSSLTPRLTKVPYLVPHPKTDKGTLPRPSPQDWQRYLTSSLTPRLTKVPYLIPHPKTDKGTLPHPSKFSHVKVGLRAELAQEKQTRKRNQSPETKLWWVQIGTVYLETAHCSFLLLFCLFFCFFFFCESKLTSELNWHKKSKPGKEIRNQKLNCDGFKPEPFISR